MNLKFAYTKKMYQLKLKVNQLTERDRIIYLSLALLGLLVLWYLAIFSPQLYFLNKTNQKTQALQVQIDALNHKTMLIENLTQIAQIAALISHYRELTLEITKLDAKLAQYNQRYINSRDLAKLVHDMLKQTLGVVIDDFSTVVPLVITPPTQGTQEKPILNTLSMNPIHYRLAMRGNYFSIMNYLKRLEELPWALYWDKFDYAVSKYPEGIVTVEFYTLKPKSTQQTVIQGNN